MRRRLTIALFVVGSAVAAALYMAARRPPSWWNPPGADEPAALALAETFERRLAAEVSRVRPDDAPWAMRIGEDQLNAWLALRLPRWLEHAGASAEAVVQAHVRGDAVELAVRPGAGSPVGVVAATPILRDGAIALRMGRVGVGAIGLPRAAIEAIAGGLEPAAGDDDLSRAAMVLLRGETVPARFDLGDGRCVELLDLELLPGAITVQLRTAPCQGGRRGQAGRAGRRGRGVRHGRHGHHVMAAADAAMSRSKANRASPHSWPGRFDRARGPRNSSSRC